MSHYHAREAFRLLSAMPRSLDVLQGHEIAGAATAHALLAVEQKLTEQQRVANTIAAFGTDGEDGLIDPDDQAAAETYVRGAVAYILRRDLERARP